MPHTQPKPLSCSGGVLASGQDAGSVYLSHRPDGTFTLLALASRRLLMRTDFHLLIDDDDTFLFFRPANELEDGPAADIVYVATQPVAARTRMVVNLVESGVHGRLGSYDVASGQIVSRESGPWRLVGRFPLQLPETETADRQREVAALLDIFKAGRNRWPMLTEPSIAISKNVALALPSVESRQRISGSAALSDTDGARFLESGYQHLRLILRIAEAYGAELSTRFRMLDWGVGCGRIVRHVPRWLRHGLTGIDVDPVNVEWCRKHIPFGSYHVVAPRERTALKDRSFDLIYSHSVLTHLGEDDQFFWLRELARISRGLMVLSVHGLYSAQATPGWSRRPHELWEFLQRGFRITAADNPDISDVVPAGYYRGASHTPAYIRATWSRYVEVIDIIPGGFHTLHDAVVCRPRDLPAPKAPKAPGATGRPPAPVTKPG